MELLSIFEKKRDLATSPEERRAIKYQIAKLYEEQLLDVDHAIETYVDVLADEPNDVAALASLDTLYEQLERWEKQSEVLKTGSRST